MLSVPACAPSVSSICDLSTPGRQSMDTVAYGNVSVRISDAVSATPLLSTVHPFGNEMSKGKSMTSEPCRRGVASWWYGTRSYSVATTVASPVVGVCTPRSIDTDGRRDGDGGDGRLRSAASAAGCGDGEREREEREGDHDVSWVPAFGSVHVQGCGAAAAGQLHDFTMASMFAAVIPGAQAMIHAELQPPRAAVTREVERIVVRQAAR